MLLILTSHSQLQLLLAGTPSFGIAVQSAGQENPCDIVGERVSKAPAVEGMS